MSDGRRVAASCRHVTPPPGGVAPSDEVGYMRNQPKSCDKTHKPITALTSSMTMGIVMQNTPMVSTTTPDLSIFVMGTYPDA